jgi:hypothetical protein
MPDQTQEVPIETPITISAIMTLFLSKPIEEQSGEIVLEDGSSHNFKLGLLDGQSILVDGTQVQYKNSVLHSSPGVATIIYPNGDMHFYTENVLMKVMLSGGETLIGSDIP